MKLIVSRSIFLSLMLSLMLTASDWAIATHWQSTAKPIVETSSNACVPVGRLISVQGRVQLKRQTWLNYQPTDGGALLCLGDLLQPAKEAKAIVQCANPKQNPWIVPNDVPSGAAQGCSPPEQPIYTLTGAIIPTRD